MKIHRLFLVLASLLFTPFANALIISHTADFNYSTSHNLETSLTSFARYNKVSNFNYIDVPTFSSSLGILTGVSIQLDSRRTDIAAMSALDLVPEFRCDATSAAGGCILPVPVNDTGGRLDSKSIQNVTLVDIKTYGRFSHNPLYGIKTDIARIVKVECVDPHPDIFGTAECEEIRKQSRNVDETVDFSYPDLARFLDTSKRRLFFEFSNDILTDLKCDNNSGIDGDLCDGSVTSLLYGNITTHYTYDEFPVDSDQDGIADSADPCPFDASNSCVGGGPIAVSEPSSVLLVGLGLLSLFTTTRRKV